MQCINQNLAVNSSNQGYHHDIGSQSMFNTSPLKQDYTSMSRENKQSDNLSHDQNNHANQSNSDMFCTDLTKDSMISFNQQWANTR